MKATRTSIRSGWKHGLAVLLCMAALSAQQACVPQQYCVRRAAVVPIPSPSLRPAKEATGIVEGGVGNETLLWAKPPRKLEGRNVGLYVPRDQLGGYLIFSPHRTFSIGFSWEHGVGIGAVPISKGLIDPPARGVGGGGLHVSYHKKVQERLTVDVGCDLWGYSIPSRIAYTPVESCSTSVDTWDQTTKVSSIFVGRAHVALGIDLGWSHLTLMLGVRNQPHNVDYSIESHYSPAEIEPKLRNAAYPFFNVGWEVHLAEWAHLSVGVYQPLNFDPVIYAPILGISFRLNQIKEHPWFVRRKRRDAPAQPAPYDPGPYPAPSPAPPPAPYLPPPAPSIPPAAPPAPAPEPQV